MDLARCGLLDESPQTIVERSFLSPPGLSRTCGARAASILHRRWEDSPLNAFRIVAGFVLLALPAATVRAQQVTHNINYTAGQTADLYTPAGPGPFPAIVYIHGGSWRSGSKSDFRRLAGDLAAKGYAGFSIDYQLSPHSFPASWLQAQAAVSFLRAHAAEYHVNRDQIFVAGTSAGGELAALIALVPEGPAPAPTGPPAPVAGAIILNGIFDLSMDAHVIARYLGTRCETAPNTCKQASPIQRIHTGAPPFFVGHGTSDHTVPYPEAQTFIAALQQAYIPVTAYTAQNGPHSYWSKSAFYAANLAAIEAFLSKTLAPTPAP